MYKVNLLYTYVQCQFAPRNMCSGLLIMTYNYKLSNCEMKQSTQLIN